MAVALIIGPFFAGHLRPDSSLLGRARMLSNMRYHTSVIISLFTSLGVLAASSRKLMKLTAYADRLQQLEKVIKDIQAGSGVLHARGKALPCILSLKSFFSVSLPGRWAGPEIPSTSFKPDTEVKLAFR